MFFLLADVFEKIRNISWKNYELCLSHYFDAPALSWDAMLNMKNVELELISDAGIYLIFVEGMRDGASYICKWYSKANLKSCNAK